MDKQEVAEDIRVRDVEVMFECWKGNIAVELRLVSPLSTIEVSEETYVLLYIFLPDLYRALPHLKPHLCCMIVHEAIEGRRKGGSCILGLLLIYVASIWAIIVARLWLRWRWRAHHGDCRKMLGNGVVKRWRVGWRRRVGASMHGEDASSREDNVCAVSGQMITDCFQ